MAQAAAASTALAPTAGSPFTAVNEFVSGLPSNNGIGPLGLLNDETHFFVTDYGNNTMYRFGISGGSAATPDASASAGLNASMVIAQGRYFAVAATPTSIATGAGLYTFDPSTLAPQTKVASFPGLYPRQVVVDPLDPSQLYVSSDSGIFKVDTRATPAIVSQFLSGDFDGMQFTADGTRLYAASIQTAGLEAFDRNGTLILTVPLTGGADGIAVAQPNTTLANGTDVSNNVFVNMNNGTIDRVDVNNANTVSTVAAGGTRGDFMTVGPDGTLYATQSNDVVKLSPSIFQVPASSTPLTITADNKTMTFGDPVPAFTYTVAGLASGESTSVVTGISCGSTGGTSPPVGSYVIQCTGGSAGNHPLSYVAGTLSVNPAPQTIRFTSSPPSTALLNGPTYTASAVGGASGNPVTLSIDSASASICSLSGATVSFGSVGTCTIDANQSGNSNYYAATQVQQSVAVTYAQAGTCAGNPGHTILQPVNADGSSVFKQGRVVPAKFAVCDGNGISIGTSGVVASFALVKVVNGTVINYVNELPTSATPDASFRWDSTSQQWIFNMSTQGQAVGNTYYYSIRLNDGTTIDFNYGLR